MNWGPCAEYSSSARCPEQPGDHLDTYNSTTMFNLRDCQRQSANCTSLTVLISLEDDVKSALCITVFGLHLPNRSWHHVKGAGVQLITCP
jgi:hypothetical protein